jgi:hypothetical protein
MQVSTQQIEWLNTMIVPNVNYWTILHLVYGMLWGFTTFNLATFMLVHLFLEGWEIYTFGHMDTSTYEPMDVAIDMIAGIVGWCISKCYAHVSYGVIIGFVSTLLTR